MKLVYKESGKEVQVGDVVILKDGTTALIDSFSKPHKPASSGLVYITTDTESQVSYYVGVIDAEWIEREDREIIL